MVKQLTKFKERFGESSVDVALLILIADEGQ